MTALAIIGWFALGIGLCWLSAVTIAIAFNSLGTYNIGGVPNSIGEKIATILWIAFVVFLWYELLIHAPFKFSLK